MTTVNGGQISGNMVGGAYAEGEIADIGNVEVNFGGEADVAAKVYAGGYVYGSGAASAETHMSVDSVSVTLDGGVVSGNVYGGVHARAYGNARVEEVKFSVSNGNHGRVYGGGWAEGNATSHVENATITINGGYVDYIYGGGAYGSGDTTVGNSEILIGGSATVGTIFMSGRYGRSAVGAVKLTFDGDEKLISRLSGVSSSGRDNADSTLVDVKTDVIADVIDFVDKFIVREGGSITANDEFVLGNRDYETEEAAIGSSTLFDIITDGVDKNWTAVAGITDFTNAQFAINGVTGEWSDDKLTVGSYTLERTEENGKYSITLLA
jgi:hypothetical protein